jgi:hypothetical protein
LSVGLPGAYFFASVFRGVFCATTHAPAPMVHEIQNAVHGKRAPGAATMAGSQTSKVYSVI